MWICRLLFRVIPFLKWTGSHHGRQPSSEPAQGSSAFVYKAEGQFRVAVRVLGKNLAADGEPHLPVFCAGGMDGCIFVCADGSCFLIALSAEDAVILDGMAVSPTDVASPRP